MKEKVFEKLDDGFILTPKDEIDICLNCPFPDCKKTVCDYFEAEKKKLRAQRKIDF